MPGYNLPTFRITMEALGRPDLWAELRDPGSLPWGTIRKAQTAAANGDVEAVVGLLSALVVGWNLESMDGRPVEKGDFEALPMAVINALAQAVMQRAADQTPKG